MMLVILAVPIVLAMLVWVVVTAMRIIRPEAPPPLIRDVRYMDARSPERREPVIVGARTIRLKERRQHRIESLATPYDYLDGASEGLPESWWEDVQLRRN